MSKNKSFNKIENVVLTDELNEIGNHISDELSHRLMHTIIDYQEEINGIPIDGTLKAVQKLNKALLTQVTDMVPEDRRNKQISEIMEVNAAFRDAINSIYGDKNIDWFVLCYVCTEIQRGILGLD